MFRDRLDAGQQLAKALKKFEGMDCIVYALPRGGVVVGAEVARELDAPLELAIARKIGHPSWPEYAIGAVTESGEPIWNEAERRTLSQSQQKKALSQEREEAKRRRLKYAGERKSVSAKGKTAIIVDDGIATGLTMIAACKELRAQQPKKIVVAVPVAPNDSVHELEEYADDTVVLNQVPSGAFGAVGSFYESFAQTEDSEVHEIMAEFYKE